MAVVKCKPTSPGRPLRRKVVNSDLHKGRPYAPLLEKKSKSGGRNQCWSYHYPSSWWWSQAALSYR